MASKRFLKEARKKVWRNALELASARSAGPRALAERLGELEGLSRSGVEGEWSTPWEAHSLV